MKYSMESVRGTRDFLPKDWALMQYLFRDWRRVCERYGFEEFEAPILEYYKMYVEKSGDELAGQVYHFKDKAGRTLALRPEMTPTLVRVYEANNKSLIKPVKWYCIPRCFRYEKPQKGRFREFFQLNVDVIEGGVEADGEVLACAIDLLREFGLKNKDFKIIISNRKLFEGLAMDVTDKNVMPLVDKLNKVSKTEFLSMLVNEGLSREQTSKIYRLANIKGSPEKVLKQLKDACQNNLAMQGWDELDKSLKSLAAYGLLDFVEVDMSVVRGLAYYTGLVFEAVDVGGRLRSILGGGAYVAGKSNAVGFAVGDAVLLELLKEKKLVPNLPKRVDFYVALASAGVRDKGKVVIGLLRDSGYNVDFDLVGRSLKRQLDYARKMGVEKVIIVGEKELASNSVILKEFGAGQRIVKIKELVG